MRTVALACLAAAVVLTPPLFGFGKPVHSAVEVSSQGTAGGAKQFQFTVTMKNNMVLNDAGPWKLEIRGHDGLTLDKTTFVKAEMDEALPGFRVLAKPEKPEGELEYSLTAFVCTKDKTQCFREVHTAKFAWTK